MLLCQMDRGRFFLRLRSWCFNSRTSPVFTAAGVRMGFNEKHEQLSTRTRPDEEKLQQQLIKKPSKAGIP